MVRWSIHDNNNWPVCQNFTVMDGSSGGNFKTDQLRYSRVKEAYSDKLTYVESLLKSKNLQLTEIEIYIQAFKKEGVLEVWARNKKDLTYNLLKTYEICHASGTLGPKRKEGDLQVPEGFYYINHFNPESSYYLSLGINYPNKSDKVFADKNHPGGSIYIHGKCVTIGCLPLTDDKIKELYILTLEAKNNGQERIPVTIFPARLTPENLTFLKDKVKHSEDTWNLWQDLKEGYLYFEKNRKSPVIKFLPNGRHSLEN